MGCVTAALVHIPCSETAFSATGPVLHHNSLGRGTGATLWRIIRRRCPCWVPCAVRSDEDI